MVIVPPLSEMVNVLPRAENLMDSAGILKLKGFGRTVRRKLKSDMGGSFTSSRVVVVGLLRMSRATAPVIIPLPTRNTVSVGNEIPLRRRMLDATMKESDQKLLVGRRKDRCDNGSDKGEAVCNGFGRRVPGNCETDFDKYPNASAPEPCNGFREFCKECFHGVRNNAFSAARRRTSPSITWPPA